MVYRKGDIHIGDPYYYVGKDIGYSNNIKEQLYLIADKNSTNLYIIGYKKQVKQLIDDLNEVLKHLEWPTINDIPV